MAVSAGAWTPLASGPKCSVRPSMEKWFELGDSKYGEIIS